MDGQTKETLLRSHHSLKSQSKKVEIVKMICNFEAVKQLVSPSILSSQDFKTQHNKNTLIRLKKYIQPLIFLNPAPPLPFLPVRTTPAPPAPNGAPRLIATTTKLNQCTQTTKSPLLCSVLNKIIWRECAVQQRKCVVDINFPLACATLLSWVPISEFSKSQLAESFYILLLKGQTDEN